MPRTIGGHAVVHVSSGQRDCCQMLLRQFTIGVTCKLRKKNKKDSNYRRAQSCNVGHIVAPMNLFLHIDFMTPAPIKWRFLYNNSAPDHLADLSEQPTRAAELSQHRSVTVIA